MLRKPLLLLLSIIVSIASFAQQAWVPGEVLVRLKKGTSIADVQRDLSLGLTSGAAVKSLSPSGRGSGYYKLMFAPGGPDERELEKRIGRVPGVEAVSLNYRLVYRAEPNDAQYGTQWNLEDINVEPVWDVTTGGTMANGVRIGVALSDLAIQTNHPDLSDNIWPNSPAQGSGADHGTEVASVLGAVGNNSIGIAGVNWDVEIFSSGETNDLSDVIEQFEAATLVREQFNASNGANGLLVVSITASWGVPDAACNGFMAPLFTDMTAAGIIMVASGPNESQDLDVEFDFPSNCALAEHLVVTSYGPLNEVPYATGNNSVHLLAPGINIPVATVGSTYNVVNGNSFAIPTVAGAIALLYSVPCASFAQLVMDDPVAAREQVKNAILNNTAFFPGGSALTITGGKLDVHAAYQALMSACTPSCTDYTITLTTTGDPVTSWSITDVDNAVILTGGGNTITTCLDDGCYTINLLGANSLPMEADFVVEDVNGLVTSGNSSVGIIQFGVGVQIPGCTIVGSGNYDPQANCNDGTCCNGAQLQVIVVPADFETEGTAEMIVTSNGSVVFNDVVDIAFDQEFSVPVGGWQGCATDGCFSVQVSNASMPLNSDGFVFLNGDLGNPESFPVSTGYLAVIGGAVGQEGCDGLDNDCDGLIDEDFIWYVDADGDGWGVIGSGAVFCSPPTSGFAQVEGDCDDANAAINPDLPDLCSTPDGIDNNCDGNVDEGGLVFLYTDLDGDGFGTDEVLACGQGPGLALESGDCDDADVNVFPGAQELCDGLDNDCDGELDEDFLWYADADGDGFGSDATAQVSCTPLAGHVQVGGDCDDGNANITVPGQTCDDGNPATSNDQLTASCICLGTTGSCPPGEIEDCNGNCAPADWIGDGTCDDGSFEWNGAFIFFNCGEYGFDGGDCQNCVAEVCDGLDNDCDGQVDENFIVYVDADGDGWGDVNDPGAVVCEPPATGFSPETGDCNDSNAAIFPNAPEICDGADNNCDGFIDGYTQDFQSGCTNPVACNYDVNTVCEDGSCVQGSIADGSETFATDFTANDVNGNPVNLFALLGQGKTVVLDFFTTWCAPSNTMNNAGFLQDWYAHMGPGGLDLIRIVSIEVEDTAMVTGSLAPFLQDATWPFIASGGGAIAQQYGALDLFNGFVPTLVMICPDRSAQVIYPQPDELPYTGLFQYDQSAALQLLNENCGCRGTPCLTNIGCMDVNACNYDPSATCPGPCTQAQEWFTDLDGDGYGTTSLGTACTQPSNSATLAGDCNDNDPSVQVGFDLYVISATENDFGSAHYVITQGSTVIEGDILLPEETQGQGMLSFCIGAGCFSIQLTPNDVPLWEEAYITPPGTVEEFTIFNPAEVFHGSLTGTGPEVCDGQDNDCDGLVDEGIPLLYADADSDGFGDPALPLGCAGNGVTNADDCDDTNADIFPGALEICGDGLDNDCNGTIDDQTTWYEDADGDGYGTSSSTLLACEQPTGYSPNPGDCDDNNSGVYPLAGPGIGCASCSLEDQQYIQEQYSQIWNITGVIMADIPQGLTGQAAWNALLSGLQPFLTAISPSCQQCVVERAFCAYTSCATECVPWLLIDGDLYPGTAACNQCVSLGGCNANFNACVGVVDQDGDGYLSTNDCDDLDPTINPGADELCDGLDNDCDGLIDEDIPLVYTDGDGDGYGDPNALVPCSTAGAVPNNLDCDDTDTTIHPNAPELVDGLDNDCDGEVDEIQCNDIDNDGTTDCDGDCNDNEPSVFPGAPELCGDGLDNDCNGTIDDQTTWYEDADGDGYGTSSSTLLACEQPTGYSPNPGDCDDTNSGVYPLAGPGIGCASCSLEDQQYIQEQYSQIWNITGVIMADIPQGLTGQAAWNALLSGLQPFLTAISPSCQQCVVERAFCAYTSCATECVPWLLIDGDLYPGTAACNQCVSLGGCNANFNACVGVVDQDGDGYLSTNDCDDLDPAINPAAVELCDGIDNDCDGGVDEGCGNCSEADRAWILANQSTIDAIVGSVLLDCIGQPDYEGCLVDALLNGTPLPAGCASCVAQRYVCITSSCLSACLGGFESPGCQACVQANCNAAYFACAGFTDNDGDGVVAEQDCDDTNASIWPNAPEICDTIDNDCDGQVDETPTIYFVDSDGDGWGDENNTVEAGCDPPNGTTSQAGDCDDSNADIFPGAPELCNGIDDDCDGEVDDFAGTAYYVDADGDGYGNSATQEYSCTPIPGMITQGGDCDDTNLSINPGAADPCDAIDQDCSGGPVLSTWYEDVDGDLYGNDAVTLDDCLQPSGYVSVGGDCDDGDAGLFPGNGCSNCSTTEQQWIAMNQQVLLNAMTSCAATCFNDPACLATCMQSEGVSAGAICLSCVEPLITCTEDNCSFACLNSPEICFSCQVQLGCMGQLAACMGQVDADGDGWWAGSDCDDANASVFPYAVEICDGLDNDCDGSVDEGLSVTYYTDADGDGFGVDGTGITGTCEQPLGTATQGGDCDDANDTVYPGAPELCDGIDNDCDEQIDNGAGILYYTDADGDGYGYDPSMEFSCTPIPGAVTVGGDCDDSDADINPGAADPCDSIDQDCSGGPVIATWYQDLDGDGFGNSNVSLDDCSQPLDYVPLNGDCDDANSNLFPGNGCSNCSPSEQSWLLTNQQTLVDAMNGCMVACLFDGPECLGNCLQDQNIPLGAVCLTCVEEYVTCWQSNCLIQCLSSEEACFECQLQSGCFGQFATCLGMTDADGDGWWAGSDCNDNNPTIYPGAPESCNGIDDDCDGTVDNDAGTAFYPDVDEDGYGDDNAMVLSCTPLPGMLTEGGDCDDTDPLVNPLSTEVCNGVDDDCNGQVDDGLQSLWYFDLDGDGYGDPSTEVYTCDPPVGYVQQGGDCHDGLASVYPGAPELCDGFDNDCDGGVDESCVLVAVRALLEGPYNTGSGLMNDGMRALGLVPTTEPYSGLGYVHVGGGGETTTPSVLAVSGSDAIVDWVLLELRDMIDPSIIVSTRSALLQRDGDVVDTDGTSAVSMFIGQGSYYLALRHRNHLGCMTLSSQQFFSVPTPTVDFTLSATPTYGVGACQTMGALQLLWCGDVTFDGVVKYTGLANDRDPILIDIGGTVPTNTISGYHDTDVNLDGNVKYTGLNNDRDPILITVGGTVPTAVRTQQLP